MKNTRPLSLPKLIVTFYSHIDTFTTESFKSEDETLINKYNVRTSCAVEVFHSPKQCYRHPATNQHEVVELEKTNYYNTTGGMYNN